MKLLLLAAVLCCGTAGTLALSGIGGPSPAAEPASAPAAFTLPAGSYLDVRTATVFGGACHIGSEAHSQGREALLAWSLESGGYAGQDLSGVRVAAALAAPGNLGLSGAGRDERISVLYIDAPGASVARAAERWLRETGGSELGQVLEVRRAAVELTRGAGDSFSVSVGGALEIRGAALPDRECCSMPQQVWYGPAWGQRVREAVVGFTERAAFLGAGELDPWTYDGANTAFLGRFGPASVAPSCCGVQRPNEV